MIVRKKRSPLLRWPKTKGCSSNHRTRKPEEKGGIYAYFYSAEDNNFYDIFMSLV